MLHRILKRLFLAILLIFLAILLVCRRPFVFVVRRIVFKIQLTALDDQPRARTLHIAHTGGGRTPPPPGETNEAAYAHSTPAAVRGPRSDTQGGAGAEQEGAEMHTGKWTVDVAAAAAASPGVNGGMEGTCG